MRSVPAIAMAVFCLAPAAFGQVATPTPPPLAPVEVTAANRQLAFAKVLEGQRNLLSSYSVRSESAVISATRAARECFLKAIELDPNIAEAYTALAEIAVSTPPNDIDEGIRFATAAVRINNDNFGGHKMLARLYTLKSGLNGKVLSPVATGMAVSEWKEVARLDGRNAEAWAFLAKFYERSGKRDDQIGALRKWSASAQPVEAQFYQMVVGGGENLAPESAAVRLGSALLRSGKNEEASAVLCVVIADDGDVTEAVELLREALQSVSAKTVETAIGALRQAVYANPGDLSVLSLLVELFERDGRFAEAETLLDRSVAELSKGEPRSSAGVLVAAGEYQFRSRQYAKAVAAFEKALSAIGVRAGELVPAEDREFAKRTFESLVRAEHERGRPSAAIAVIERSRKAFGPDDLFADRQLIAYYRLNGKRAEALAVIRGLRARFAQDQGLRRLEASVLADLDRVDEAVAVIRAAGNDNAGVPPTAFDKFSDLLFISGLYGDAGRGKEASDAANEAYSIAGSEERKQIARLSLAAAQQIAGDYSAAESTLRDLLRQTPGNPIALNNLGYYLVERGERLDEAVSLIRQALAIDPTNPSYLDSLGWAKYKLGKYDDAERSLRSALRYNNTSPAINDHLGDVLDRLKRTDEAVTHWRRALQFAERKSDIARIRQKIK